MASYKTTLKKKTNNDTLYPQTTADIVMVGTDNVQQILNNQASEIATLQGQVSKFKGYFTTEAELLTAYPNNIENPQEREGWYAYIKDNAQQNTVDTYVWDVSENEWLNVGQSLDNAVLTVNLQEPDGEGNVTLTGANIDATANLETKSVDNHLQSLYNEIDTIAENSGRVIQLDFTGTLENNVWTFELTDPTDITLATLKENNLYELHLHSNVVGSLSNTDTMVIDIENTTINIANMFTTGETTTVGNMAQVFREDNELGHYWSVNAIYNEKTVGETTIRTFTIQPTVNDIPQSVKDTLTELTGKTNVLYLTNDQMLNAIETNTYNDGQTALCIDDNGYEIGHIYKFTYLETTPVTYEWTDITAGGSGGAITEIVGTQDNPINFGTLPIGAYVLSGYYCHSYYEGGTPEIRQMFSEYDSKVLAFFNYKDYDRRLITMFNAGYTPYYTFTSGDNSGAAIGSFKWNYLNDTPNLYSPYGYMEKLATGYIQTNWLVGAYNLNYNSELCALTTKNNNEYTPTFDYNPATKKYVDDKKPIDELSDITTITDLSYKNKIATNHLATDDSLYYFKEDVAAVYNDVVPETSYNAIYFDESLATTYFSQFGTGYSIMNCSFAFTSQETNPVNESQALLTIDFLDGYLSSIFYDAAGIYIYNREIDPTAFTRSMYSNDLESLPYIFIEENEFSNAVIIPYLKYQVSPSQVHAKEIALSADLENKLEANNIIAGNNVTISTSGNNVTINASGGGSSASIPLAMAPQNTYIKYNATAGDNVLHFATSPSLTGTIDKGDGTSPISTTLNGDVTLNYQDAGVYWISIASDTTTSCVLSYKAISTEKEKLLEVYLGYRNYNSTFIGCLSLSKIEYLQSYASFTGYPSQAFSQTYIANFSVPSGVTSISEKCFYTNLKLSEVTLPTTVTTINTSAFEGCENLISINLKNVTSIGARAFYNCNNLRDIKISTSCAILGKAFVGTSGSIKHVYIEPIIRQTSAIVPATCVSTSFDSDTVIHVPHGYLSTYQSASGWSTFASQMVEEAYVNDLGTASTLDTGTTSGTIPVIGNNGKLDSSIVPSSGGGITRTLIYENPDLSVDRDIISVNVDLRQYDDIEIQYMGTRFTATTSSTTVLIQHIKVQETTGSSGNNRAYLSCMNIDQTGGFLGTRKVAISSATGYASIFDPVRVTINSSGVVSAPVSNQSMCIPIKIYGINY